MKISYSSQAFERKNNSICIVTEYPPIDNDLDFALVHISGRYPDTQQAINTQCKEIVYVQRGTGHVTVNEVEYELNAGDVVLIEAGETFFWEGNMLLHIVCTPPFSIEQHIIV